MSPGVAILGGPTASGKSELALALALHFDAEIVGADSRQIYRDMPLGTAAPSAADRALVPHHLIGFLDPYERYSAARFVADALRAIDAIEGRGRRALVVGGTGFYLRALCGDVALSPAFEPALRARLVRESEVHPPEVLHDWLRARAPLRAAAVRSSDRYRVARALEIALAPPREVSNAAEPRSLRAAGIPFLKLRLERAPAELNARIEARVDAMLAAGFLEEAERIGARASAADAVGYPEALAFLAGFSTFEAMRFGLARATRRYAKRQATWWRGEPNVLAVEARAAFASAAGALRERLGWEPRATPDGTAAGCAPGLPEGG